MNNITSFLHSELTRETAAPLDYYDGHFNDYKERLNYDSNPIPITQPVLVEHPIDDFIPWEG